jgi:hypothetical protein
MTQNDLDKLHYMHGQLNVFRSIREIVFFRTFPCNKIGDASSTTFLRIYNFLGAHKSFSIDHHGSMKCTPYFSYGNSGLLSSEASYPIVSLLD